MRFLRNLPIKRKLTIINMLTSGVALVLTCLVFIAHELVTFRTNMIRDLAITADMVGYSSSAALSFKDPESATDTLKFLKAEPNVIGGAVYDKSGRLLATYKRAASKNAFHPPPVEPDGHKFTRDSVQLFRGINLAGENAGTVYIQGDLNEMYARLWHYGFIAGIVMVAASFVAFLLSTQMQRVISGSVAHLSEVVNAVITGKNYSIRAVKRDEDDLGRLIDAFNEMLNRIQIRDSALQEAHNSLEQRVAQRTDELQKENAERTRAETFLHSVLLNLPITIFIKEAKDLRFVMWNKAGEELTGYTSAEMTGKNDYDFFPKEHADHFVNKDREALAGDSVIDFEEEMVTRYKGKRIVHTRKIPIRDEDGRPIYLLGITEDITQRKESEAALETVHKQLLDTSRQAGMAEVATGVLHNVGNVLNSVNVSTTLVADQLKKSKVANLAKVVALLNEHAADPGGFIANDPKGKQLPGYLTQLSRHLATEQTLLLDEMEQLRGNIEHIKDIVAMQQSYAKVSGVTEMIKISDLVEDALRMNSGALLRHEVEVVREFAEVPQATIDKHKVLQVLVNLIRNAKYACDESGRRDKKITVRVANGDSRLKIGIIDNGVGIPQENLVRIFNHGFTTRKEGHGFGLHSGALAAMEMGGSLSVHSDGLGKGASFTLEIPLQTNGSA